MRLIGSEVGQESGSSSFAMESRAQRGAAQRSAILFAGIVAALIPASDESWARAEAGGMSMCASRQSLFNLVESGDGWHVLGERWSSEFLVHDKWW